jgi:CRP/FNR family transcriptional regulator, cyclic AMP receptor protein
MIAPCGLKIIDDCVSCPVKKSRLFCNLPLAAAQRLQGIKSTAVYSKGTMLFLEGQRPRGVFVLCMGAAKLSTSSRDGKTVITKIAEAGDVLGLNATISDLPYEVTAEMMEPGQANFIPREPLILMMRDFPEVTQRITEQLSRNYFVAHDEIRTLGLATSPSERFAKLLLQWSIKATQNNGSGRIKLSLTQSEIAELIGTTRETVARLFAEFKRKHLVHVQGATVVIHSRFALEQMVNS